MARRRFFLAAPPIDNQATLTGEEAHHLIHVLRVEIGRSIELIDGSGKAWRGVVTDISSSSVKIRGLLELPSQQPSTVQLTLVQALCKADKLEWILQKVTELGVSEIRLLDTGRSILKIPGDKLQGKLGRWNKIILGAAKQSRRATLPRLYPPAHCETVCQSLDADLKLLFSEGDTGLSLKTVLRRSAPHSVAFCVGPEGGWTRSELETFSRFKIEAVTLGAYILRTETAAMVGMAILKYELEG